MHPAGRGVATRLGHLQRALTTVMPSPRGSRAWDSAHSGSLATGQIETSSPNGGPRNRRRLHGRLAAVFFMGAGVLGLVTLPLPMPGLNLIATAAVSAIALFVGIAAWLAPWEAWPRRARPAVLPPPFPPFALGGGVRGLDLDAYTDF